MHGDCYTILSHLVRKVVPFTIFQSSDQSRRKSRLDMMASSIHSTLAITLFNKTKASFGLRTFRKQKLSS